jgi:hypothetical protein
VETEGKIIKKMTNSMTPIKNGITPRKIISMGTLVTLLTPYSVMPMGG